MYIYFNKQGVLTTQIPHGEIVRQSGSVTFRFAFEDDYIFDLKNNSSNYTLTIAFKRPGDKEFGISHPVPTSPVPREEVFTKVKPSEMTYSFVDGKKYRFCDFICADYAHITERPGEVQAVVRLLKRKNGIPTETVLANVDEVLAQGLVQFNVERTYGMPYKADLTLSQFDALILYIDKQISGIANAYIKSVNYDPTTTDITFILQDNSPYVINLNDFLDKQKGVPNGVATLDIDGVIPNKHIPLANELEIGGIKARHINGYNGPINEIVIDQNTAKAFSTYNGTITFGTEYLTELGVEDLKSIVLENPTIGFVKKFNILKNDKKQVLDLTPYITINSDLTSGSINQQGYDLLVNKENVFFKLNTKNNRVLVFEKESDTPNIELSTRYYENQRYYMVKFTIKSDLTLNIGGVDFVTLEDLLRELMGYATKQYVDNKVGTPTPIKEIHLFGDKRVMVPQDTQVTNIDLYCHMIHIKGDPITTGVSNFDVYFEFYSSKNTPVDSAQDMKLLLGNGFYRSCNGLAKGKVVYAIYEKGGIIRVKCNNSTEELLQGIVIEDMVKTI